MRKLLCIILLSFFSCAQAVKITFLSSGFFSHFHTLQKAALQYTQDNPGDNIQFITVTFGSFIPPQEKITELEKLGVKTKIIHANTTKNLKIALDYTQEIANYCSTTELLMYDYYLITGYLVGKILNIPTICSITGALGSFDKHNEQYQNLIQENTREITELEKKYHISIKSLLQHKDTTVFIPSDETNIVYGYQKLVESRNYNQGRNLAHPYFCIDELPSIQKSDFIIPQKLPHQKLIYVSFGTMFTKMQNAKEYIQNIFTWLIDSFKHNDEYIFILANPGKIKLPTTTSNFFIYDSFVPQTEILKYADLFITHAGAHSLNEALHEQVPMIAIPFFWDQHLAAKNIHELEIGKAFLHGPENQETAMFLKNRLLKRNSLTQETLKHAILEILQNYNEYKKNIEYITHLKPQKLADVITFIKNQL